ncbi:hypothetical protein [Fluviicola taffensis]|uniref:Knr4/Smi1-like domain-containing protein n=1 Tax=Fluviicola taffensis (strain DSM 16823 / NCIMB 13979 / RW262) TaxID=755732 RepID=F2IET6_FLUTR|nr:hypothetical protein [Fluviicola taffensis]AEA45653.1 hypothetical protein Fluta_3685 [Fluviicola taffensis DSM 16823]
MNRVESVIDLLEKTFPDSKLGLVKSDWLNVLEKKYGDMPKDLKELYAKLGYGTIGDSYYSIHVLLEPDEIYDEITANELKGKYIVGDDFCGTCQAYDADNNWVFGSIDSNGKFNILTDYYADYIDFLEKLAINEIENG